jgi:hypothetical protein
LVELDVGSTGFEVLRGRESVVGVGKGVGFPVGGEGRICEMGKILKMNSNVDPAFSTLFFVKKKRKQNDTWKKD